MMTNVKQIYCGGHFAIIQTWNHVAHVKLML